MLSVRRRLRVLGPADLPDALALLARDPVVNVVTDYRARLTQLQPMWLGGEMWGYFEDDALVSVCHAAVNMIPAQATPAAIEHFAAHALHQGRQCWTLLGPQRWVDPLWARLEPHWSPARLVRSEQHHLEIRVTPNIAPHDGVRRTTMKEIDLVYPACVAMYTEEVGVSPEIGGGADRYRARVAQLISRGWSFALFEDGRAVFKAEIAAATPYACQIQDVFVVPDRRGEGLGARGVAAIVEIALREIAPVVSLYVNDHNLAARGAYARVGFQRSDTFTSVLF